jgi:Fur family ferric uptake transcriptional regulator
MQDQQATIEALRGSGHRLTPQRVMVLSAIGDLGGHVSVDEIHQQVLKQYPYIDVATVYRTVGLLKRLHVVNEVLRGGVGHYELADPADRHHHMVCEHCGRAIHIPTHYLDALHDQLVAETGFDAHMEHFTISGLCADCQRDPAHSHSGKSGGPGHDHTHGGAHTH